jgi:ribosomal protein S18 acetylase RimI-like enzyme
MPDVRPRFGALASKTITRVRTRGPREVIGTWFSILRQLHTPEQKLVFFFRNLDESLARTNRPAPGGTSFRQACGNDAAHYARDIGTDSPRTFEGRLSERTFCFVVLENEAILHASWVTTAAAWTREIQRYLCPPSREAYIYESYTRPETRGRGIYPFALHSMCAWLAGRGFTRVWVGVEDDNTPSLKAVGKGGFERGFEIRYRRRLGRLTVSPPEGPAARPDHLFLSTSPECRPTP